MYIRLLLAVVLIFTILPSSGQSLADVVSSVQERKRAVEQSRQVSVHLPTVDGDTVEVDDQELIEWTVLSEADFPTSGEVDSLDMDGKVALLNQAIMEFRNLQSHYVNLRKEDLEGGNKIGVIRRFLPEDFPDLGRASSTNYHTLLSALARDVRRLTVLPWPVAGKEGKRS